MCSAIHYDVNTWNHYAFVKDMTAQDPNYCKVYHNGIEVVKDEAVDPTAIIGKFAIGGRAVKSETEGWNLFRGKIDDFRIYKVVLTDAEIRHLADMGDINPGNGQLYVPPLNDNNEIAPANVYNAEGAGNEVINFKDYATIADEWLVEQLWPR
jgi:hypothetical protein